MGSRTMETDAEPTIDQGLKGSAEAACWESKCSHFLKGTSESYVTVSKAQKGVKLFAWRSTEIDFLVSQTPVS